MVVPDHFRMLVSLGVSYIHVFLNDKENLYRQA